MYLRAALKKITKKLFSPLYKRIHNRFVQVQLAELEKLNLQIDQLSMKESQFFDTILKQMNYFSLHLDQLSTHLDQLSVQTSQNTIQLAQISLILNNKINDDHNGYNGINT